MKKLKQWFKDKLRSYLGINKVDESLARLHMKYSHNNNLLSKVEKSNQEIVDKNDFIINQFNISADIYPRENHSWAVISIHGKPEYVRFVNLSNNDMREIHSYLKRFEGTNRTIDSPFQLNFWQ